MTTLPSGLPVVVEDEELLARHIFSINRSDLRVSKQGVVSAKASIFMPQPTDQGWLRSVTRTCALADDEAIQKDGQGVGELGSPNRVLHASALITAAAIRSVPVRNKDGSALGYMDVLADEPPLYHAHIVNYPEVVGGDNPKELQKDCAQHLADKVRRICLRALPMEQWELEAEAARQRNR